MAETTPLRRSVQRHTLLLNQIHAHANTPRRWTRTRNPRKTDPASGLPNFLYTVADPQHRPSLTLQHAVRELDRQGLLTATPAADDTETLDLSELGTRTLTAWTATAGIPSQP